LKLTNGLDEKQILEQANKISEINDKNESAYSRSKNHQAHYDRLDLKDDNMRMTGENNIKLVIDSEMLIICPFCVFEIRYRSSQTRLDKTIRHT
jgi:hypothetical protein